VIVVVGPVFARGIGPDAEPDGLAAALAVTAAAAGGRVELVARIGDDKTGDTVLLALAREGVGHVALLRDPVRPTRVRPLSEPPFDLDDDTTAPSDGAPGADSELPTLDHGDVSLALRYLVDFRVIAIVHPGDPRVLAEVVAAASYAGAHLVVITDPTDPPPEDLPEDALVVTATEDAEGVGEVLGRYAAAVDGGEDPATAFAASAPLEPVEP
jgi:sugar/nucleoside kinase (ribokinase family)